MTTASLRRYANLGTVTGQVTRVGNRVYVSRDLTANPRRARRRNADTSVSGRQASLTRETSETRVSVEINLDGQGRYAIQTGEAMLDHLLAQLARHGLIDITLTARGDAIPDAHHLAEDVAIVLGRALRQAIGDGTGIRRMGSAMAPLDDALAQAVVDAGGRGYAVVHTGLEGARVGDMAGELVSHFLERLALEGGLTLHARVLSGSDPHHKAEALFKALARALRQAVEIDPRATNQVPSTKGTISG
ncbi:MAG: imidazoleglycerol-phosphate dehydratase HisB [Dehalococcoidia bacterium]|nr:imidazoleglycerol-phosphate dehydratase HisB [Dehalococcoidia bacterium]